MVSSREIKESICFSWLFQTRIKKLFGNFYEEVWTYTEGNNALAESEGTCSSKAFPLVVNRKQICSNDDSISSA